MPLNWPGCEVVASIGTDCASRCASRQDVPLPFPFTYYSRTFAVGDVLRVSANGYFTFGTDSVHHAYGSTMRLPHSRSPHGEVAVYWTDLFPAAAYMGAEKRAALLSAVTADGKLVVTWQAIPYWVADRATRCPDGGIQDSVCQAAATFQAVLSMDGSMRFNYQQCDVPSAGDTIAHAPVTIGFENYDGSLGVDVAFGSTASMVNMSLIIAASCHHNLPGCAAQADHGSWLGNHSDYASLPTCATTRISPVPELEPPFVYVRSLQWVAVALVLSLVISGSRLWRTITRGHIWRGIYVPAQITVEMVARGGLPTNVPGQPRGLSQVELDSLQRLTFEQLTAASEAATVQAEAEVELAATRMAVGTTAEEDEPPPEAVMANPPGRVHHTPDDMCAICMSPLSEADAEGTTDLLQLPCSHAFHRECLDPWLSTHSRACPYCKRDAIFGDGASTASALSNGPGVAAQPDGVYEADGERTPEVPGGGGGEQVQLRPRVVTWHNNGGCDRVAVLVAGAAFLLFLIAALSEAAFVDYSECDLELSDEQGAGGQAPITAQEAVENSPTELTVRCGFFVVISLFAFLMATIACALLHIPSRGRVFWDSFSGWALLMCCLVSVCAFWYEQALHYPVLDGDTTSVETELADEEQETLA